MNRQSLVLGSSCKKGKANERDIHTLRERTMMAEKGKEREREMVKGSIKESLSHLYLRFPCDIETWVILIINMHREA